MKNTLILIFCLICFGCANTAQNVVKENNPTNIAEKTIDAPQAKPATPQDEKSTTKKESAETKVSKSEYDCTKLDGTEYGECLTRVADVVNGEVNGLSAHDRKIIEKIQKILDKGDENELPLIYINLAPQIQDEYYRAFWNELGFIATAYRGNTDCRERSFWFFLYATARFYSEDEGCIAAVEDKDGRDEKISYEVYKRHRDNCRYWDEEVVELFNRTQSHLFAKFNDNNLYSCK